MRRLLVTAVLTLLSTPLVAGCIADGHYTLATSRYPYTEDLSVVRPQTIRYDESMQWTLIQSGCTAYDEANIRARTPVNVLLRASFNISKATGDARFEVQLRVDDDVAATAIRTLRGRYPYGERFGAIVRDLQSGGHRYSMWLRMLDAGEITIGLQWITAQGVPSAFPAQRVTSHDEVITEDWRALGEEMSIDSDEPVDLSMLTSYRATGDGALMLGWSVDGESAGPHVTITAATSTTLYDHAIGIAAGKHTLRLYARMAAGAMTLHELELGYVAFPNDTVESMGAAIATDPVTVTSDGSPIQPASMSEICGRWTKLLDLTLDAIDGKHSWVLNGYIEITGWSGEGTWGVVGIDAVHLENGKDATTDMGMFQFQLGPQHDGISFYGDCSKWGNFDVPARLSLWVRRVEYCAGEPAGGTITIGRRWLAVKLLPSLTPHLQ